MASSFVTYSRGLTMITPEARAATWWKAGSCAARKQGASGNDLAMALLWSACVFVVGVSVSTRSLCLGSCLAWGLHVVPTHHEYKVCIHTTRRRVRSGGANESAKVPVPHGPELTSPAPPLPFHFILLVSLVVISLHLACVYVTLVRNPTRFVQAVPRFLRLIVVPYARRGTLVFSLYSPRLFIGHKHRLPLMRCPVLMQ